MNNRQESEGHRESDEPDTIMDSGVSEHVVTITRYLSDMGKIPAIPVELVDGTEVNAKHKGIVNVDVRG